MIVKFNDTSVSCDSVMKNYRAGDTKISLMIQIEENIKDDQYYIGLLRGSDTVTVITDEKEENYKIINKDNNSYSVNYTDTGITANIILTVKDIV